MGVKYVCRLLQEKVASFDGFSSEEIAQIVSESNVRSAEENEAVIEFGNRAAAPGVLLKGRVRVCTISDTGEMRELARIDAPGLIGEMAFLCVISRFWMAAARRKSNVFFPVPGYLALRPCRFGAI
ncbi:MAG: cyclic nucleotide-binding domain-containing protein [Deltaproteobacteria bacterium]|nr:cyclic nucleotide-binding domain-containing protein [Deltaproteobacteria bacterium]